MMEVSIPSIYRTKCIQKLKGIAFHWVKLKSSAESAFSRPTDELNIEHCLSLSLKEGI